MQRENLYNQGSKRSISSPGAKEEDDFKGFRFNKKLQLQDWNTRNWLESETQLEQDQISTTSGFRTDTAND